MSVKSETRKTYSRPGVVFPGAVLRFVSGPAGFEVASVNRRATTMLDATADDLSGTGFADRLFRDDARLLAEALTEPDRERSPFILRWGSSGPVSFLGVDLQADSDGSVLAALHHTTHVGDADTLPDPTTEQFWRMANHDALTGLPNRSHFNNRFDQALARSRQDGRPAAVLFCDLDHFERVNDEHGHAAADALLIEVAHRLTDAVRETDTVCRLGADEFVVLCEALDDLESLEALGGRLIDAVNRPILIGDATTTVGICIGIASAAATSSADQVIAAADAAVHQAKRNGRNGYVTSGSKFTLFGTNP